MHRSWLVAFALWAASGSALAGRVAVLPADGSGRTSKETLRQINQAVAGLVQSTSGVDALVGVAIKKKARADARACGEQPACLAKIGRRLKVDEVVTVRVRAHGNGLRLTFLAIGVEDRRLRRTVTVNADSVDGVEAAVRIHLAKILGVTQAELFAAAATDEELALEPMPSLAPLPGVGEMSAQPEEEEEPLAPVDEQPTEEPEEIPVESVIAEAVDLAAVSPEEQAPAPAPEASTWMWYSGLGLLGAGAVLGGVSTAFGVRYLSKKNAIEDDTPQVRTQELVDEANAAGKTTNITAIAAGVLAAAGAGLLVADLVTEDVSVSVSVGDGVQAGVSLRW